MIVLDTDHMTILEWANSPEAERLRARMELVPVTERATSIITYEEQMRGWLAHAARARNVAQQVASYRRLSRHIEVYRQLRVLEFDERAATQYQRLRQPGLRVGTKDLQIAAIVLSHDATLLTRIASDFRKVPGLKFEDWTA
jgi:tRNA(fMet)-specific endonuclease VapC